MELERLYEAVPAAQEEDLLEELVVERHQAQLAAWIAGMEPAEPAPEDAPPEPEDPQLTPGQVLGLVQHQLGAVVLPEDP